MAKSRTFDVKVGWVILKDGDPVKTGPSCRAKSAKLYEHEKRAHTIAAREHGVVYPVYVKLEA